MASKSKRRGRVFRASCILAALIIAGSSFAWFTSKDEVTNRLTASADYGVSIIENFAPPKQWVPGETVKKEEAVTNTGSIDAFVKQTISGVLTVTVEVPTDIAPTAAAHDDYITLNEKEYGSIEAGSYVAYSPNAADVGRKVIQAFTDNGAGPAFENDFAPTTDGLYIFRRAIDVEIDPITNTTNDTAYEYVGYYFVDGIYYKIYSIDETTLDLVEGTSGNLASAPTVKYSKETTKTLQNVPMTYQGSSSGSRLVVSYSTDEDADLSALSNLDRLTYDAYRAYMDQKVGKTKWDISRGIVDDPAEDDDMTSWDAKNVTGLTDYDEFNHTAAADVKNDLSNWSLARLESRATETSAALAAATPAAGWDSVYQDAVDERKIVNKGVKSAERLTALRDTGTNSVTALIGYGGNGLVQDPAYAFHYDAEVLDTTNTTPSNGVYAVSLLNHTAVNSTDPEAKYTYTKADSTTMDVFNLTADNMDEPRFADNGDGTFGDAVKWNDDVREDPFGTGASGAVVNAWNNYVTQTKRLELVNAKLALLDTALTTTDVARDADELREYKEYLIYLKGTITNTDETGSYDLAKKAYEDLINGTETTEGIAQKIQKLNDYQDDINAANEVTGDNYGAEEPTANPDTEAAEYAAQLAKYPTETTSTGTWRSTVNGSGGTLDTGKEVTLKNYLEAVYGVAYKDSGYDVDYVGTADTPDTATDLYKDYYTYSPTVTKDTVDANLTSTSGVIGWQTPTGDYAAITTSSTPYVRSDVMGTNAFDGSPYYEDQKVNFMKNWRNNGTGNTSSVTALKAAYDALLSNADGATQEAANSVVGPIELYVNLANLDETPTAKDKWQYIANATGANEYNFYYTGILQSGETSSLLIKSVEMSDAVTQDMFRNLQFDLNVTSESAQVTYEGDTALSTAAKASITGADPELERYGQEDMVKWVTPATTPKAAINDEDPNPKEAVYVVSVGGVQTTVTNTPATIDDTEYAYKLVDGDDVYYGQSTASGTVFKKVADPAAATLTFADPAETKTLD